MVNTARPEATLRYLKPASFAENQVGVRHAHMVKVDLGVAVGGVVVPEREEEETHIGLLLDGGRSRLIDLPTTWNR